MSIVVLGTVALDTITTPYGKRKNLLGGSAVHFAMSARFFTGVHLAAVIGIDFPREHLDFLKRRKIALNSVQQEKGCTFRWEGEYKPEDLNTACTLNTELGVITECFPRLSVTEKNLRNVFLGNYDPDIQLRFLKELAAPQLVGLDTMNLWIHNKRAELLKILKKADIFIVNETEAKDLSREKNLIKAAKCLNALGPQVVIIKKGEHGAIFHSRRLVFSFTAYPLEKVIDPTGAGDTFAGGVMGVLAGAKKVTDNVLRKAVAYGTVCASFNVEDFGTARTASLTMRQVDQRLKILRKHMRF